MFHLKNLARKELINNWFIKRCYSNICQSTENTLPLGSLSCFTRDAYTRRQNQHTGWGRVTHICVSKLTIIGSDNGFSLDRRQAITWTNAGILLTGPLGTNLSEIWSKILTFKKMRLKVYSAKWRPFCLGLNLLIPVGAAGSSCWFISTSSKLTFFNFKLPSIIINQLMLKY